MEDARASAGISSDAPFEGDEWRADLADVAAASRADSRRFAELAVRLARLASHVPRSSGDHRGGTAWTSFLREVAVARRVTDRAATTEVAVAVQLVRCLPVAMALLSEGRLPVAQARALAEETVHCDDDTAGVIDAELSERGCTLATWRLREAVQRRLLSLDADAAADRAARATAVRDVTVFPLRDDQAVVTMTGPAVAIAAWYSALDAQARALRAAGDPRTLDALRFDLATATAVPSGVAASARAESSPQASSMESATAGLAGSPERFSDCRLRRPVQLLVHVPVETALGLSNEPGWLDGVGWISAPQVRQLLPVAELRQVCITGSGQVIDLADRAQRPPPTPADVRAALIRMATEPFTITGKTWRSEPRHDPSDALREFVAVRDRFCDGPTQPRVPAARCDDDHRRPYPDGPTAAWNLGARARRTHTLKHFGWTALSTPTGTLWISPAGQLVEVDRVVSPPPALDAEAVLPDADALHALEKELLREPRPDEHPPVLLPLQAPASQMLPDEPPFSSPSVLRLGLYAQGPPTSRCPRQGAAGLSGESTSDRRPPHPPAATRSERATAPSHSTGEPHSRAAAATLHCTRRRPDLCDPVPSEQALRSYGRGRADDDVRTRHRVGRRKSSRDRQGALLRS